jgi:hypothetical protein
MSRPGDDHTLGAVQCIADMATPRLSGGNPTIPKHRTPSLFQGVHELLNVILVFTGVANKYIGHRISSRSTLWRKYRRKKEIGKFLGIRESCLSVDGD